MEDLQVQWSQVAWSQLPAMVASYPSNLREMHPLLEMLGEILLLCDISLLKNLVNFLLFRNL
jgi:hypothetical protein